MALLKLTPIGEAPQLFNSNRVYFGVENSGGSQFHYNYLNQIQNILISESYEDFLASFGEGTQAESIPLSVVSQDGEPVDRVLPINISKVVNGIPDPNGTLLIYSETPIGISPASRIQLLVSQTVDEILEIATLIEVQSHDRLHDVDSILDHNPSNETNKGKFLRANPDTGAIEFTNVGEADKHFEFFQGSPELTWVITHNLEKYPSVTVLDSAGTEVECEVQHNDINTLTLNFSEPFAGSAYLN